MSLRRALAWGGLGLGVVIVGGIVALVIYATSDYTECYAQFDSTDAAEQASEAATEQGFDAEVEHRRPGASFVTFSDGETGDDAKEFIDSFHEIVEEEQGRFAHPGSGCLSRPPLGI